MRGRLFLLFIVFLLYFIKGGFTEREVKEAQIDLKQAIIIALKNNLILKQKKEAIKEYEAKILEVVSKKGPSLSLQGSYINNKPEVSFTIPTPRGPVNATVVPESMLMGQATLTYLISSFGKISTFKDIQTIEYQKKIDEYKLERINVILNTSIAYLNLLKTYNYLNITKKNLQLMKIHLNQAELMYKVGQIAEFDLIRTKVAYKKALEKVFTANKMYSLSRSAFLETVGLPLNYDFSFTDKVDYIKIPDSIPEFKEVLKIGLKNRIELKMIDLTLKQAKLGVKAAKLTNAPSLALQSTYKKQTKTAFSDSYQWQSMLVLTIPIFNGGQKRAKVLESKSRLKQATLYAEDIKRKVGLDIQNNYLTTLELKSRLDTAKSRLIQAEKAYKIAMIRYKNGLSTNVELLDTELALSGARVEKNNVYYDFLISVLKLKKAMGILDSNL